MHRGTSFEQRFPGAGGGAGLGSGSPGSEGRRTSWPFLRTDSLTPEWGQDSGLGLRAGATNPRAHSDSCSPQEPLPPRTSQFTNAFLQQHLTEVQARRGPRSGMLSLVLCCCCLAILLISEHGACIFILHQAVYGGTQLSPLARLSAERQ